ncbi:2-dehydropantoate 2-reductase [Paenibacillus chitinolyticus]|uniref:ketopantoate reductase family protein n=1 Tax=Paenibacillus chitinolyticus TaxID=79263 RepID=UPI002DB6E385|nr:2-dehydropantoate 2-reductase [Paenibacillus chitinolyticus]MEC0246608.1 2-dehydropantoate 2-reductase [Paenibacillus chitinolyticus]
MLVEVVGGGSLGLLFAAKLAAAGCRVKLVTRSKEQAEAVNKKGIRVEGWTELTAEVPALAFPDAVSGMNSADRSEAKFILLAVKQTAFTEELASYLISSMEKGAGLVSLQNGIGHWEKLDSEKARPFMIQAVTTEGARRLSHSEVAHTGRGWTRIGHIHAKDTEPHTEKVPQINLKTVQDCLKQAGFDVFVSKSIERHIWSKLLINAVINPLTALLRIPNGKLPETPDSLLLMRKLFEEGRDLALTQHVTVEESLWDEILEVCRKTAVNRSSMLQDIAAGRMTEIEAITGGLLAKAELAGMSMPTHETVYRLIKAAEQSG